MDSSHSEVTGARRREGLVRKISEHDRETGAEPERGLGVRKRRGATHGLLG